MVLPIRLRATLRFERMVESSRMRAAGVSATPAVERPSDRAVVAGLLEGEAWAAEELYLRTHLVVERSVRRVLQSVDSDVEDLVQLAFEKIVRSLVEGTFSGDCRLSTWASAIASNIAVDHIRARIRERDLFPTGAVDAPQLAGARSSNIERQLEARAELARLHAVLQRMNEQQAKVIVLHDVLGHELKEIAAIQGVSVAAAQSALVRGRRELVRRAAVTIRRTR
jgi:RNA polymerase sigma factor (sigma-70 family)